MANYHLASQLTYTSLDLLDMADKAETLQKLENCHEILRDATPDDRLLAVRNLPNNLRLRLIRVIHSVYRAAPSEFPSELAALIAEYNSFARAFVCYDGAPAESRCAEELCVANAAISPHFARRIFTRGILFWKRRPPARP